MAYRQLSDGRPDGNVLGQSVGDSIGFYGKTAAAQLSGATQAEVTPVATTTLADVVTDLAAVNDLVSELRLAMVTLGLIKGSA